jgi:hypothetical protein
MLTFLWMIINLCWGASFVLWFVRPMSCTQVIIDFATGIFFRWPIGAAGACNWVFFQLDNNYIVYCNFLVLHLNISWVHYVCNWIFISYKCQWCHSYESYANSRKNENLTDLSRMRVMSFALWWHVAINKIFAIDMLSD